MERGSNFKTIRYFDLRFKIQVIRDRLAACPKLIVSFSADHSLSSHHTDTC